VSVRSRVTQDRRRLSRLIALLSCKFTYKQVTHNATLVDLSIKGAFLSSIFLPPIGGPIRVFLQSRQLKKPLALDGIVVRGGWGTSERGKISRFGVRFNSSPLELISLLHTLIPNPAT
jgi:hypothetical protein